MPKTPVSVYAWAANAFTARIAWAVHNNASCVNVFRTEVIFYNHFLTCQLHVKPALLVLTVGVT